MNVTLVTVLCLVVALAGLLVTIVNEPPAWLVVAGVVIAAVLSTVLLRMPALAEVADSSVGAWSLRLAICLAGEAVLTLVLPKRWRTEEI
ncbi:hypothetical protein [Streptomyces sp. NPDC002588]|uniref:hypothetical protein n=1 Tax=Streptomyces sp. NPDC002588 TaxID=3154419 RepID=UPI00331A54AA